MRAAREADTQAIICGTSAAERTHNTLHTLSHSTRLGEGDHVINSHFSPTRTARELLSTRFRSQLKIVVFRASHAETSINKNFTPYSLQCVSEGTVGDTRIREKGLLVNFPTGVEGTSRLTRNNRNRITC